MSSDQTQKTNTNMKLAILGILVSAFCFSTMEIALKTAAGADI